MAHMLKGRRGVEWVFFLHIFTYVDVMRHELDSANMLERGRLALR